MHELIEEQTGDEKLADKVWTDMVIAEREARMGG